MEGIRSHPALLLVHRMVRQARQGRREMRAHRVPRDHRVSQVFQVSQGTEAIAHGKNAGSISQQQNAVAIGATAGHFNQGTSSIAIGAQAGATAQGSNAVAIGREAGTISQGSGAIAIGYQAGNVGQTGFAVAMGYQAGRTAQGLYAVAIGYQAGLTNQSNASIAINATPNPLNPGNTGFFVDPVRGPTGAANALLYDTNTREIVYQPTSNLGLFTPAFATFIQTVNTNFGTAQNWTTVPFNNLYNNSNITISGFSIGITITGFYRISMRANYVVNSGGATNTITQFCDATSGNPLTNAQAYQLRVGQAGLGVANQIAYDEILQITSGTTVRIRVIAESGVPEITTAGNVTGSGVVPLPLVVAINRVA